MTTLKIDLDEFSERFSDFSFEVIDEQKVFFYKYLLIRISDCTNPSMDSEREKAVQDLKKLYGLLLKQFPNFQLTKNHKRNLGLVLGLAMQEWQEGHLYVVQLIYDFFFRAADYHKMKRKSNDKIVKSVEPVSPVINSEECDLADSCTRDNAPVISSESIDDKRENEIILKENKPVSVVVETSKEEGMSIKQTFGFKRRSIELFNEIFKRNEKSNLLKASFQRFMLKSRKLTELRQLLDSVSSFEVKYRPNSSAQWQERYAFITQKSLRLFRSRREYLISVDNYSEIIFLIKEENFSISEENGLFELSVGRELDETCWLFLQTKSEDGPLFTIALCGEYVSAVSDIVDSKKLPSPLETLGQISIRFSSLSTNILSTVIYLSTECVDLRIESPERPKTVVLSLINPLEVIKLETAKESKLIEVNSLLNLDEGQVLSLTMLQVQVDVTRRGNFMSTYTSPSLLNYHEARAYRGGIQKTVKELKNVTFRLKRSMAIRDSFLDKINNFLNFKYALAAHIFFILLILVTFVFSLLHFTVLASLLLLFGTHPSLRPHIVSFLNLTVFSLRRINKDFVEPKWLTSRAQRKIFYMNMANMRSTSTPGIKEKLTEQFKSVVDFSEKLPYELHGYIDIFDKTKNLLSWKDRRKTTLFLFFMILGLLAVFSLGVKVLVLLYVVSRYIYGRRYFKRVGIWNRRVLEFLLEHFAHDVMSFPADRSIDQFFEDKGSSPQSIEQTSIAFSKFLQNVADLTISSKIWNDKFSKEGIIKELWSSNRRIILPIFEEKRPPSYSYLIGYFVQSTPSDMYYSYLVDRLASKKSKKRKF